MSNYKNNFAIVCKTYKNDFKITKTLKNSIDKFNIDNIPLYIICPKNDLELFSSLKNNKEKYSLNIITDEEILNIKNNEQNWNTQQFVKMEFYKLKLAKFYLIVDSDSYFIKDFYIKDFMCDDNTPYIVMHEGKYFKEICNILGDKNVFEMGEKIKNYFKRDGKDYQFLTTPIVFSSEALEGLEKINSFAELMKIAPLEAYWHGEFILKSNIINYKPCEPFFKCFNYQVEYKFWKNFGELERDIQKNYYGIVMQNRWVKQNVFKDSFYSKFKRKTIRQKHFVNTDRAHIKHNFKFYRRLIKGFIKEIFKKLD